MSGLRDTIQRLISESQPICEHPTDAIMAVIEAELAERNEEIAEDLEMAVRDGRLPAMYVGVAAFFADIARKYEAAP